MTKVREMSATILVSKTYLVLKKINAVMSYAVGLGVLALTAVIMFEMISRFGFGRPTVWSLDVSRYLLLLVGLFSLSCTMQEDAHVYFSILIDAVPPGVRKIMELASTLFGLAFCGVLSFYSFKLAIKAYQMNWGTMAHASIPLFYLYLLMGIGALMFFLTYLFKTIIETFPAKEDDS